jgi:hypothetical protein
MDEKQSTDLARSLHQITSDNQLVEGHPHCSMGYRRPAVVQTFERDTTRSNAVVKFQLL